MRAAMKKSFLWSPTHVTCSREHPLHSLVTMILAPSDWNRLIMERSEPMQMLFPSKVPRKRMQKRTQALLCTLTHESMDMIFFPEKSLVNKNLSFHSFITLSFLYGHITACKLQPDILILNM